MENFELIINPESTEKVCGKCKENKTIVPNFSITFRKDRNRRTISSWCKECTAKKSNEWYGNNKHTKEYKNKTKNLSLKYKKSGQSNNWTKDKYHKYKQIVFEQYGNKCSCCGEMHAEFLTLEHKLHDGKEHRLHKRSTIYKDIIDRGFPNSITLFCSNCNFATRYGHGCPHQVDNIKNNVLSFEIKKVAKE